MSHLTIFRAALLESNERFTPGLRAVGDQLEAAGQAADFAAFVEAARRFARVARNRLAAFRELRPPGSVVDTFADVLGAQERVAEKSEALADSDTENVLIRFAEWRAAGIVYSTALDRFSWALGGARAL